MSRTFSGGSDQAAFGSFNLPNDTATMSAWFKATSFPGNYYGVGVHISASNQVSIYNHGTNFAYYIVASGNTIGVDPGAKGLSTGTWYHAVVTYDPSNGGVKTFVNGVSDGTAASTFHLSPVSSPMGVGYDPQNAGRNINGSIGDVAEWNVVLSAGEITSLANGARPHTIRPANLIFYAPLDGLQSPEPDLSGNAHNGTLTGTAAGTSNPPTMMFTPRWPQNSLASTSTSTGAGPSFMAAWAQVGQRMFGDGIGV